MNKLGYPTSRTTVFMHAKKKKRILAKIAKRNAARKGDDPKLTLTSLFEAAGDRFLKGDEGL